MFNYAKNAFISVYNWLFLILGIVFGTLGEKIHNFTLEEMAELLFYLSFTALIYLQGFNNNYIEKA